MSELKDTATRTGIVASDTATAGHTKILCDYLLTRIR